MQSVSGSIRIRQQGIFRAVVFCECFFESMDERVIHEFMRWARWAWILNKHFKEIEHLRLTQVKI